MRRLAPLLLLLVAPAAGYAESEAAALDERIDSVWHEPAVVEPGTQWYGFLRLDAGHDVASAYYQICTVGDRCFAPPTQAERLDALNFRFDTRNYTEGGEPIDYEAGWHLGVKWCLQNATAVQGDCEWVPAQTRGLPPEDHYFTFHVARSDKESPPAAIPFILIAIVLAALARRT